MEYPEFAKSRDYTGSFCIGKDLVFTCCQWRLKQLLAGLPGLDAILQITQKGRNLRKEAAVQSHLNAKSHCLGNRRRHCHNPHLSNRTRAAYSLSLVHSTASRTLAEAT